MNMLEPATTSTSGFQHLRWKLQYNFFCRNVFICKAIEKPIFDMTTYHACFPCHTLEGTQ